MFRGVGASSPALELNNMSLNGFAEYAIENLDNMEQKANDANFNLMVNQLYMNQICLNNNDVQLSQQQQPIHYQYSMNNQISQQQNQQHRPHCTIESIFNDSKFLTRSLDDISASSASTSTLSELDSLQFIHPQDVVSFPSVHACTPPFEQLNSRRSSLIDNSLPLSLMGLELSQQQSNQPFTAQAQSTEFLSSVETTRILSELSHLQTLNEVADQKLSTHLEKAIEKEFSSDENTKIHYKDINLEAAESDIELENEVEFDDEEIPEITEIKNFRVVRGISSGGCATRPPKEAKNSSSNFAKVKLHLSSAGIEDMCLPSWNELERLDRRRIIRIERRQHYADIVASFSIVGSAIDHPEVASSEEGVDVVEVSCLETVVDDYYDDYETESYDFNSDETLMDDDEFLQRQQQQQQTPYQTLNGRNRSRKTQYYITSVEVIKIVELLIGSQPIDGANRRRERGRIRSNLVPFWSRKPVSSKKSHSASSSPIELKDFRIELAQRIMGYEVRKPRGFDKEVRILKWEKLIPALRRALQSYYAEIPFHEC